MNQNLVVLEITDTAVDYIYSYNCSKDRSCQLTTGSFPIYEKWTCEEKQSFINIATLSSKYGYDLINV